MALQLSLPLHGNLSYSGAVTDATITADGATVNTDGRNGQSCYLFNNTRLVVQSTQLQNIFASTTSPFSFAAWIYVDAAENDRSIIFGNWNASFFVNWELTAGCNQVLVAGSNSNYNSKVDTYVVPKTTWTHIVAVYTGSATKFYANGVLQATVSGANTLTSKVSSNTFWIGSDYRNDATRFRGRLSDLRIYNHALTQSEISTLSETAKRVTYKGKKIEALDVEEFYERLNVLRNAGGVTPLTIPALEDTRITASQVKTDLFSAITSTKSAVSFLSGVTLPYGQPDATTGNLIRASLFQNAATTTIARAEKNIGTMEAACRAYFSTNASGWSVNCASNTVGSWSRHCYATSPSWSVNCSGNAGFWSSNNNFQGFATHYYAWYGDCYGHAGHGSACHWRSWTNSTNCSKNKVGSWGAHWSSNTVGSWSVNCSKNTVGTWSNNAASFTANNTTFTVQGLDFQ